MFKKLLSNLPFNPSLIGEVVFYAKRLKREAILRRSGLIILSISLGLQVFAFTSPPQPSLASSSSDLITGGFSNQAEAVSHCQQNTRDYGTILRHYGITCENVADATTVTVSPHDYADGMYIMGRLSYGVDGETPATIPGVGTLYLRHFWSLMKASNYKALKGTDTRGNTFYILYLCGNPVFIGIPVAADQCEYVAGIYATDPSCVAPCPIKGKESLPKASPDCYEPCPYNKKLNANDANCFEPCPVKSKTSLPKTSPQCFEPCKYDNTISSTSEGCKPCSEAKIGDNLTVCIKYEKSAANTTQGGSDANGTTVNAGDEIQYTLTTTNTSNVAIKGFVVTENINDVLDYADVQELNGGSLDDHGVLTWPAQDITAGASVTTQFGVRIKSPIPFTPASESDPAHFDMKMTNVYGNTVTINLPANVIKTTELVTTQTLPNTGPGASLALGFSVVSLAAFLFARSKLFVRELAIVKQDYSQGTMVKQ